MKEASAGLASLARAESLALFAVPALVWTAGLFLTRAPESLSLWAKLVFLAPLFVVSLTLAAYAIRERSAIYAFASGLILNLAVTLGCLFDTDVRLITALQVNVITSAMVSLVWLEVRGRLATGDETGRPIGGLLQSQIAVTLLASLSLLVFADVRIFFDPAIDSATAAAIGNGWGWLAMLLAASAWLNLRRQRLGGWFVKLSVDYVGIALLAAVSLIVCSLSRMLDGWASYHALMIGVGVSGWLMFALRYFKQLKIENIDPAIGWATALGALQFVLAVRGAEGTNSFWWTVGSFASLSLLFGWLAIALKRRSYVYLSAPLCNVIASMLIVRYFEPSGDLSPFVAANVVVLSLTSLLWLWLDKTLMRPAVGNYPFHRQTIFLVLPAVFLLSGFHWLVWTTNSDHVVTVWLNWAAIASVAALLIAYLWEENILASLRGLHLLGGIVILEACCVFQFSRPGLFSLTVVLFSIYALAVSWLWRRQGSLAQLAEKSGISAATGIAELMRSWLLTWHTLLTGLVLLAGFGMVFEVQSLRVRLLTTTAAFALPAAFALLVRGEQDLRLITASIRLCLLNAVLWSWAWLPSANSGHDWQAINRLVIIMLIIEAVLIAYRLVVMRRVTGDSLWRKALRADLPVLALIGLASLAFVLVVEFEQFSRFGAVSIGWSAIV
ncbi:MAG: hypothetical protein AAB401_14650, partial [Acidobacteriota bacterium]